MEHADQSGAFTVLPSGRQLPYRSLRPDEKEGVGNYMLRNGQLQTRVAELRKVRKGCCRCTPSAPLLTLAVNSRLMPSQALLYMKRQCGTSTKPGLHRSTADAQQLQHLRGKLNFDHVAVTGHSFGGATALAFAIDHPRIAHAVVAYVASAQRTTTCVACV